MIAISGWCKLRSLLSPGILRNGGINSNESQNATTIIITSNARTNQSINQPTNRPSFGCCQLSAERCSLSVPNINIKQVKCEIWYRFFFYQSTSLSAEHDGNCASEVQRGAAAKTIIHSIGYQMHSIITSKIGEKQHFGLD